MGHGGLFAILFPFIFLGVPIAIGIAGWIRCRGEPKPAAGRVEQRTILLSSIVYTIAFNVTFFIQELFLVVPKALTPGLEPTLFHNNHNWEGSHPLESLFQGTGALAILISGLLFAWLAKRGAGKTEATRLFVLWMAYNGLFQSLPQFATASANPGSDTGQALDWFGLPASGELAVSVIGIVAIVAAGLFMTARFLESGPPMESAGERSRFVFLLTVVPAIIAIPVLILFRVPREWLEVVVPTIAVPLIGLIWVQANAWRTHVTRMPVSGSAGLTAPLAAMLALLAAFQLVLRPGIAFY